MHQFRLNHILETVERLGALLAEWPLSRIRQFFEACDIRVPQQQPPASRSRRWLIERCFRSLNWHDAVDVLRLQMLCTLVNREARGRVPEEPGKENAASRRMRKKLEQLEMAMRKREKRYKHSGQNR